MDPGPFTLAELTDMAEARADLEWDIARAQIATLLNVNRKKGARAITGEDLKPKPRGKVGAASRVAILGLMDVAKAQAERRRARGQY